MNTDWGHSPKPPDRRPFRRTIEFDVVREIREDLFAAESGPQYVLRERMRGRIDEKEEREA